MKKVRYLVGSVGVAAPVIAAMMPAPAVAAPHDAVRPAAKTVSLRLTAATVSSSSGNTGGFSSTNASPSPNTNGTCTGSTGVRKKTYAPIIHSLSTSMKFWYRNATHGDGVCIGTVEGTWFTFPENPHYDFRVRIYSGPGRHRVHDKLVGGSSVNSHTLVGGQAIHQWFGASRGRPIEVCAAWVYVGTIFQPTSMLAAGPACATVR